MPSFLHMPATLRLGRLWVGRRATGAWSVTQSIYNDPRTRLDQFNYYYCQPVANIFQHRVCYFIIIIITVYFTLVDHLISHR